MTTDRKLRVSYRTFEYGVEQGYIKFGACLKDENNKCKCSNPEVDHKGGWIADREHGELWIAALAIKDKGHHIAGAGFTEKQAVKNLEKEIEAYLRVKPEVFEEVTT